MFCSKLILVRVAVSLALVPAAAHADGFPMMGQQQMGQQPPQPQSAPTPAESAPKVSDAKMGRLQSGVDDAKSEQRKKNTELQKAKAAAEIDDTETRSLESQLVDLTAPLPEESKWTPEQSSKVSALRRRIADARAKATAAHELVSQAQSDLEELKDSVKSAQRRLERAEEENERGANKDCAECNKDKAKYQGKSGWESFADIVKAVTPLGLGAMNLYGQTQAMNLQSSNYQLYANTMSANGLPFSPPTSTGYSSLFGNSTGLSSMGSLMGSMGTTGQTSLNGYGGMNMFGANSLNGFGASGYSGYGMLGATSNPYMLGMGSLGSMYGGTMGYGSSMGMTGYNPYSSLGMASYSNPYPSYSPYSSLGTTTYSNPYSSLYSSLYGSTSGSVYGTDYAAQLRLSQQSSVTSQDAQSAQAALYAAQTRYYGVLGSTTGVNNLYGSTYSSGYTSPYTYSASTSISNRQ